MGMTCWDVFLLLAALIPCSYSQNNGGKNRTVSISISGGDSLPQSDLVSTVEGGWTNTSDENARTKVQMKNITTTHRDYYDLKFDREDFLKRHTIHQRTRNWKTDPLDRATIQRLENKLYQNYESLRKQGRPPLNITNSTIHIVAILDDSDLRTFNARLDTYEKEINAKNCIEFEYKLRKTYQRYLYSGPNESWTDEHITSKNIVGKNSFVIVSRETLKRNASVTGFNLPPLNSTRTIAFKPSGSRLELSVAVSNSTVLVPVIASDVDVKTLTIVQGKFQDFAIGLLLRFTNAKEHFGLKEIDSGKQAEFEDVSDEKGKVVLTCPEGTEASASLKNGRLACNARETNLGLECFGNSNAKQRRIWSKKRDLEKFENQVWKQPKHKQYKMPSSDVALVTEVINDLKNGDHIMKTALGLRNNVQVGPMTVLNSIYNMNQREQANGNSTLGTNLYLRGINVNDAIREKDPEALAVVGAKYFGQPVTQALLRGGPAFFARALWLVGKAVSGYMGEPGLGVKALLEFPSKNCSSGEKGGGSSVCDQLKVLSDWFEKLDGNPNPSTNTFGLPETLSMQLEELERALNFKFNASEDQLLLEAPEGYISIVNETQELHLKQFMLGIAESELFGIQPRIIASNNLELLGQIQDFLKNHSETYWGYVRPAYRKFQGLETVRYEDICQRNKNLDYASIILGVIFGSPFAVGIQAGKYFSADQCETLKKFENSRSFQNNIVDLGDFGLRHLEQWSPNLKSDSSLKKEDFFCPPANAAGMDGTSSVQAFKCVDALGYKIQEPGPGLTALIDLEVGDDSARGSRNSSNLFVVDDGRKDYEGGPFSDTFLIQGKPSGVLNGGEGEDVLDLSLDLKSKSILIEDGVQVLKTAGKEKLELRSIEVIRGRPDWMDLIYAACNSTLINGQSGRTTDESDRIFLGSEACVRASGNPGKLQVMVSSRTHVTNLNRERTTVFNYFVVKSNESYSGWNRKITIEYSNESSENHVQFDMPLEAIGTVALTKKNQNESTLAIRFSILDLEISFDYRNYRHIRMFFGHETEIVLVPTLTTINSQHNPMGLEPAVQILLDPENKSQVFGAKNNLNFFVFNFMRSGLQNVTGGNLNDVFLFMKPTAVKTLVGGNGTDNTIELDNRLQGLIKFDFVEGTMQSASYHWNHTIHLVGKFARVLGRWNESEEVIASCNVRIVDLKFQTPAPELRATSPEDIITIPDLTCPLGHHAVFHIHPSTKLVSRPAEGAFTYMVHRNNRTTWMTSSSIHVTIPVSATCLLSHKFLLLDHKPEDITDIWFNDNKFKATVLDLNVSITFLKDISKCKDSTNVVFILSRGVSASVLKLPERTVPEVVFQFNLTLNDEAMVKGHENTSNVFLIRGNTARDRIQGGKKNNLFIFGNHSSVSVIVSGASGNSYIEIAADVQGKVVVDLHRNKIKWSSGKTTEIKGRINMIIGRKGGSEVLETGCETGKVDLNGGTSDSWDEILVPRLNCKSVPERVTFEIHPYTNLTSSGSGKYVYRIVKASTRSGSGEGLETVLDLSQSQNGTHYIKFEDNAQEMENWSFDTSSFELKVKARNLNLLVKLPKEGDPFARSHFISKDNARILFKPRNSSDQLQPHVLWNISSMESSGRDTIKGWKKYSNTFFLNGPQHLLNLTVQGGDQNDEFILGPEAWIKKINGGNGTNVLVLQKSSQEISLPQKTISGPLNNISLEGRFTEVHAELGTSTTVIPNCDTEFVDLTQNFTSSGSSPPGNSLGDFPSTANLVMIRNLSSCDYDLGIQLAPRLGTLWVLNGADRGRFKYFLPLVDSNITLYHVMRPWKDKASSDNSPERYFHYQFSLPVNLTQVSDINHKSQNSYMTFDLLNGARSRVEVLSVPSQKGLEVLRKQLTSKEGTSGKGENLARTPQNYLLKFFDGYEVLVDHKRIADTMKTVEGTVQTDTRSYIVDKCKIPNALGLTLTHQTKSNEKNGVPNKDIQIAGSDETDDLSNSDFNESHLVANAGSSTVFRIRPTTSPVFIYVPALSETNPFEESESTHVMDWTAFYPIPVGVLPSSYVPQLSIPTVVRDQDHLILKGSINSSVSPGRNHTVIYVDGVLSYKRMSVKLYTCLYEFHEYQNPSPNEAEEWLWALRIREKPINEPPHQQPKMRSSKQGKSVQVLTDSGHSRRKRSAVYDQVYEFQDADVPADEAGSIRIPEYQHGSSQITVTSYADFVEYQQAGASVPLGNIAASGQETSDTIFFLEDSLVMTNTLQDPTYLELTQRYFGFGQEPTMGRQTIVMVDMRSDMEKHNFTLAIKPEEDPRTGTVAPSERRNAIVITHLNFTEFRNATKVAEDIANRAWIFNICMTIFIVLLVCLLIYLLCYCCFKYRYHLKWILFLLKRTKERKAARASKRPKVCRAVDPTSVGTFHEGAQTSPSQVQYFPGRSGSKSMDSQRFQSHVSSDRASLVFQSPATSPKTSPEFDSASTSSRATPELQSPVLSAKALPMLQSTSGSSLLLSPTSMDMSLENNRDESVVGTRKEISPGVAAIEMRPDEDDTTLYKFICRIWNIPVYQSKEDDRDDV